MKVQIVVAFRLWSTVEPVYLCRWTHNASFRVQPAYTA